MAGDKLKLAWHHVGPGWLKGSNFLPSDLTSDVCGVYLIYRRTLDGRVVIKIGEGQILNRLRQHRRDPAIIGEAGDGSLLLTWADVQERKQRLGVERFLTDCCSPKFGSVHLVRGLVVNLPFQKWAPFS